MSHPAEPQPAAPEVVQVTVVRTGGIAGLTRRWSVAADPSHAPKWTTLVAACPWRGAAVPAPPEGADRFSWELSAVCDDETLRAVLADQQLTGPWRTLVDAVRDAQS